MTKRILLLALCCLTLASSPLARQAAKVTTPLEEFGHNFGDDYFLANYKQLAAYWRKLDQQSDRMIVESIGKTAEGRDHLMAIVTSPENHKNLARYKEISRRLALAEGLTDDQARALAKEGKSIVWIDGGLHASETLGAQQLGEMVYQMVSRTDEETMRILSDVVILFVHANPDGHDLVADWYMRNPEPTQRSMANLPRLYHYYIGHDNNRDFFASTQRETENINRLLYHEWFPQILYNHHQSGPAGTILWSPPFRDPFNYNQDPLLVLGLQTIGLALQTRLAVEGKPGAASRDAGAYDGWWNGGIRNTAAFHNTIAILTEMIGSPTPMRVPLLLDRQIPTSGLPYPVPPGEWHFRQSVDYSIACNRGVLDVASRMRENFLYNRYVMGRNSIERGRRDHWTPAPHRYAAIAAEVRGPGAEAGRGGGRGGGGRGGRGSAEEDEKLWAALRKPEHRDPRAYIIPSDQPDFPTATKFVNALLETGIVIHRATADFSVQDKKYPAGSFVVQTAQAFRPHVIDMFEPQDHPDNIPPYEGARPIPPYDSAGWTFAYQMGVEFDRILEGVTGPFERIDAWNLPAPKGRIPAAPTKPDPLFTSPAQNDAFVLANRLLAAGEPVTRATDGAFVIAARPQSRMIAEKTAADRGVHLQTLGSAMATTAPIRQPRIGLWDQYGGSMDSGWARWILEQFEFKFTRVFPPDLDAGNLNAKYDVLIFVAGGIPNLPAPGEAGAPPPAGRGGGAGRAGGAGAGGPGGPPADIPAEFRGQMGSMTAAVTMPAIRQFIESGGHVVAIGSSAANLARYLNLPLENHLVENGKPLTQERYYVPRSILRAAVDSAHPLARGMAGQVDVFFDNSPVWKLGPNAQAQGVTRVAWIDSARPLRSGWAWGQQHLQHGVIAVEATVGKGRVMLFGPEILERAQPHGTFKFLFNSIYR